jgi:SPP1 family predicted phage head-tail adaptor
VPAPKHYGAGLRDRPVTIEQLTATTGPSGFPVEAWTPLATLYAFRRDVRGRERFAADQQTAPYDTVWEVNYTAPLDPELVDVPTTRRLVAEGRVYEIVAAALIGRRLGIELSTLAGGLLA